MSFRAVVVVGNGKGKAGFGIGKANEVPDAIRKAVEQARKNMIEVPLKGLTIPHDVESEFGPSKVILKPASRGHGMVAGRTMRAFFDVCGVRDITCKCLGSTNPINVLNATVKALKKLKIKGEEDETSSVETT